MEENMEENTIYEIVTGAINAEEGYEQIENEFAEGSTCDRLYAEIYETKLRLNERLGKPGQEDADVEHIINNMFDICEIVGKKMFDYGSNNS